MIILLIIIVLYYYIYLTFFPNHFQHHYSSLQCYMIRTNHSNMLICCSRDISDHYYFWLKITVLLNKVWKVFSFPIGFFDKPS